MIKILVYKKGDPMKPYEPIMSYESNIIPRENEYLFHCGNAYQVLRVNHNIIKNSNYENVLVYVEIEVTILK